MPADETSSIISGTSVMPSASRGLEEPGARRLVASAALIGVGMLIEPELLGGALLGAGVMYGLPLIAPFLRPIASTAVQLGYSAVASAGDLLSEARQQVEGILATARSDFQRARGSSVVPSR